MEELTQNEKQFIFSNFGEYTTDMIISYITNGQMSRDEVIEGMAEYGVAYDRQNEIKEGIGRLGEGERIEKEFYEQCVSEGTISRYNEYLTVYPNGRYSSIVLAKIEAINNTLAAVKHELLTHIKNNPTEYNPNKIKDFLDKGTISEDELIEANIVTKEALDIFLNPPEIFSDQKNWKDREILPPEHTDVFFFGIPRSGKSCVLAGILKEASKSGLLKTKINNYEGVRYMNELIRSVDIGYVPPSTTEDAVNYISCELITKTKKHPLSFIEMSGEFFKNTYERTTENEDSTILTNGYLQNKNRKAFIFVIDYFNDTMRSNSDQEDQLALLNYCINKLETEKCLEYTDSIQIVVTKSDLMPNETDQKTQTINFLNNNYKGFLNELERMNQKYGINLGVGRKTIIHNFSLGKFMLGSTYIFDRKPSVKLLKAIMAISATKDETLWGKFKKIFIKD